MKRDRTKIKDVVYNNNTSKNSCFRKSPQILQLTKLVTMNSENINSDMLTSIKIKGGEHIMDLNTLHLVSTMKTELLGIAMMIETDNKYTREKIKNSLLDLITRELEGYEVSLLDRNTDKE